LLLTANLRMKYKFHRFLLSFAKKQLSLSLTQTKNREQEELLTTEENEIHYLS